IIELFLITPAHSCDEKAFSTRASSRIHANNRSSITHLCLSSALDHQSAKQKLNIISITPAFLFAFPGDGRTGQYAESSRETGAATPAMEMEGRTCPRGQAVAEA